MANMALGEQLQAAVPDSNLETVRGWVSDYLQDRAKAGVSTESINHYRKALNAYVRWLGAELRSDGLDAGSIFGFLEQLGRTYTANSVRYRGEALVTFCNWLAAAGRITLEEADLIARTKNALINGVSASDGDVHLGEKTVAAPRAERGLPPLGVAGLAKAVDEYISDKVARREAADIYKSRLHWFLRWVRYIHDDPDATLTADDFCAFGVWLASARSKRQNRQLGERMQREILKRLRSVLRWAFRNGHLAHDYVSWVPYLVKQNADRIGVFDDSEIGEDEVDLETPTETGPGSSALAPKVSTINLRVWLELFLTAKRAFGLSQRTLAWYSNHIGYYLRWVEEHNGLLPLDVVTLEYYLAMRRGQLSPFTLRGIYRALFAFCAWLVKRRYITANESPMLHIDAPKVPSKRMKFVTVEEFSKVYSAIGDNRWTDRRDRVLFNILFYSGLRADEVVSLRVADIERGEGVIHVKKGKGNKSRVVPYHPDLPGLLDAYLKSRPRHGDGSLLFLSARGPDDGQPMRYRGLTQMLRRRCKSASLRLTLHAFRHGFAMWALNNGVPISALAAMMGHSSVTITESTNARWVTSALTREYTIAFNHLVGETAVEA